MFSTVRDLFGQIAHLITYVVQSAPLRSESSNGRPVANGLNKFYKQRAECSATEKTDTNHLERIAKDTTVPV